jgi:hypothetical protein
MQAKILICSVCKGVSLRLHGTQLNETRPKMTRQLEFVPVKFHMRTFINAANIETIACVGPNAFLFSVATKTGTIYQ